MDRLAWLARAAVLLGFGSWVVTACGSGSATVASIATCTTNDDCTEPTLPNCSPQTWRCVGPCPDTPCDKALPNCFSRKCTAACSKSSDCPAVVPNCRTSDGVCFAKCTNKADCVDSSHPDCDPTTGSSLAACPERACAGSTPNCGTDGTCFGKCATGSDCGNPAQPNCDATSGVCQGPCPATACPSDLPNCTSEGKCFAPCTTSSDCIDPASPNCDPSTGRCVARCAANSDCPDSTLPNCGASGICVGQCSSHAGCTSATLPNCQRDPNAADQGRCGPACKGNADCTSAEFPNCDTSTGQCQPPCASAADCPASASKCDASTGLCFAPECVADSACAPPATVCEGFHCIAGCGKNSDCSATERCNLRGPPGLYHCEPRDCASDSDCTVSGQVCDTDGLAEPNGGGYCVSGCKSSYDCGQLGYDCDAASGRCTAHDYGDIGQSCAGGCKSGFCLTSSGNVCTGYCCTQNDCPGGWGCRLMADGSATAGHTVDVCVPLASSQGIRQYGEACSADADCRSNICRAGQCAETCCTDANCAAPSATGMACSLEGSANPTTCLPAPTTGTDPMGALGCGTTGTASDCRSRRCFTFYQPDTGCTSNAQCSAARPICFDFPVGGTPNGIGDCVRDMCVADCCTESDCPSSGGDKYYCGKVTYPNVGDYDVCLYHFGTATLAEGAACTSDGQCVSNYCSPTAHICRHRCCTDSDCRNASYPRCALEQLNVLGVPRLVNVCQP